MKIVMPSDNEVTEHVRSENPGCNLHFAVIRPVLNLEITLGVVTGITQTWDYELSEEEDEADAFREDMIIDLQNDYGELGFPLENLCRVVWVGHVCPRCEFRSEYKEAVVEHIVGNH